MPKGKPRGRPLKYPLPERIDATPERIAEVVLHAKPKQVWQYEQQAGRDKRTDKEAPTNQ